MDLKEITKGLIEIIATTFKQHLFKDFVKQSPEFDADIKEEYVAIDIHCDEWKQNALTENYKIDNLSTSSAKLTQISHDLCGGFKRGEFKNIHPLDNYFPSEEIINISKYNNANEISSKQNGVLNFLEKPKLNASNICDVYWSLLNIEDVTILQEYLPLIQRDVTVESNGKSCHVVKLNMNTPTNFSDVVMPDLDQVYVLPANKKLQLKISLRRNIIKMLNLIQCGEPATVRSVTKSTVTFDYIRKFSYTETYDLIFVSQRIPIRFQYRALKLLEFNPRMCPYLFPKADTKIHMQTEQQDYEMNVQLINTELGKNQEQLDAVRTISCGLKPTAPYIIFGPPGTGKTTTIVESILQLRLRDPQSRILVTAGSNSACDTVALRICEYFKSSSRLQECSLSTKLLPIIRIYSKSALSRKENISDIVLKHSNKFWINGTFGYPAVQDIAKYGIVVATLCTVGKLVLGNVCSHSPFTHVFIDEAAASSEPETLIGIMGIKTRPEDNCHIILSGDHKQLGPVIKSNLAEQQGLGQSMMKRLMDNECYAVDTNGNYNREFQARLRRNYRSHPEIVGLYNYLYYDNELIAMNAAENDSNQRVWSFLPNSKFPIGFQAVHGTTKINEVGSSCNHLEINVLAWYVKTLLEVDGVQQADIGVITPYKNQCSRIKERLNKRHWKHIEVGTVENFQGREKDIIIVSMVRSFSSLGFIKNPHRLNVMLSRPKSLLLIIGNPLTLSRFKDLEYIINKIKAKGNYLRKEKIKLPTIKDKKNISTLEKTIAIDSDSQSNNENAEIQLETEKVKIDSNSSQPNEDKAEKQLKKEKVKIDSNSTQGNEENAEKQLKTEKVKIDSNSSQPNEDNAEKQLKKKKVKIDFKKKDFIKKKNLTI